MGEEGGFAGDDEDEEGFKQDGHFAEMPDDEGDSVLIGEIPSTRNRWAMPRSTIKKALPEGRLEGSSADNVPPGALASSLNMRPQLRK